MTSQLSWQPPPVTKCGECFYSRVNCSGRFCAGSVFQMSEGGMRRLYDQNKDGITPTCPMWKQQNKEAK